MAVHHESLESKIAKLPVWAREHIKRLELRAEDPAERLAIMRSALESAENRAERYKRANSALMEVLGHAGRNHVDWAGIVVDVLEGYEIFREPEKVEHADQTPTQP